MFTYCVPVWAFRLTVSNYKCNDDDVDKNDKRRGNDGNERYVYDNVSEMQRQRVAANSIDDGDNDKIATMNIIEH